MIERIAKEFIEMTGREYPILAKVIADYQSAQEFAEVNYILSTRRLVPGTKEKIRLLTEKNRDLLAEIEALKWKLGHIVSICPNIEEIFNNSNVANFVDNYSASIISKAHSLYEEKFNEAEKMKRKSLSSAKESALALRKEAYDYYKATWEAGERYLESKKLEGEKIYSARIAEANEEAEKIRKQIDTLREEAERFVEGKRADGESFYEQKVTEGNKYYDVCIRRSKAESYEQKKLLDDLLSKKIKEYPIIATMLADYFIAKDAALETRLINKKPPAIKAAEEVRRIKDEKRKLIAENLAYKWELEYIKTLVPWVDEIEDEPIVPENNYINPDYQSDDGAGHWLSPEEYNTLPVVEKCQLALDRYRNRNKSRAEIGRDYERYIGYLYEQEGYNVEYFGIQQGLEDMGRDLICKKGDVIHIVQCKCWSNKKQKVIHEKHINQLYGTTVMYEIETGNADWEKNKNDSLFEITKEIAPVFYSTVPYSDKAIEFAKYLGIKCKVVPLKEYPMIKCNISGTSGKRYTTCHSINNMISV